MKKPDFSKIKIITKRDWVVFWFFAALITYAMAGFWERKVDDWLRSGGNPWLCEGNEPQSYGRLIVAAVIFALVVEVVCFLRHKKLWIKLVMLAAGILAPVALAGMYRINCQLIVSVLWEEQPEMAIITWKNPDSNVSLRYEPDMEEQEELLEFCRNMTIVSDVAVQNELMERMMESGGMREQDSIYLHFSEKYGHSYMLKLYVWGDYLYFFRGHGRGNDIFVTLFQDNGLIQYMETLRQEQEGAAE